MLCYFGVGHARVSVAQMSQLFESYLFFFPQAGLFPHTSGFHSDILAH